MTFASPWAALVAAAIVLPLLLLLYFLKLRRASLRIPSTLLWKQSFEDIQVNAPFQRLRWSALLFLQLLLIILLLLAMSQPRLDAGAPSASRLILLIDCSASMQSTVDAERSRLDQAKEVARDLVARLGRDREARQMLVIAFARRPEVLTGFEAHRGTLEQAIDGITAVDEEANLDVALQLAGAMARQGEDAAETPPDIVLLSDGGVAPPMDGTSFRLRSGQFRFLRVGDGPAENLGIVSLSARRDFEDPMLVTIFGRIVNSGPDLVESTVRFDIGDATPVVKRIEVPASTDELVGEFSVTHEVELSDGAVIRMSLGDPDRLAVDDVAAVVLPPPDAPRLLVVHPDDADVDADLLGILDAAQPRSLRAVPASSLESIEPARLDAGELYDLIVFDRVAPQRLPGIPTITLGASPPGTTLIEDENGRGSPILSWDRQHPVLRHVGLDSIVYAGAGGYELPGTAESLAIGPGGPVIALLRTRGARHIAVAFELGASNWPLHLSFTVFFQNALDFLTLAASGNQALVTQPGDSVTVRGRPGVQTIGVRGLINADLDVTPGEPVVLPVLRRAGLYTLEGAAAPHEVVAVSVLSDVESDIRGRPSIAVNAEAAGSISADAAVPMELWPWFVMAAFVVLVLEWLVYCWKIG